MRHILLALAAVLLLSGCMKYRVVKNGWADLEDLARQTGGNDRSRSADAAAGQTLSGYAIEVARYEGKHRGEEASQTVALVQKKLGYDSAWVLDQDNTARVVVGRFASPVDQMAGLMLKDVRGITVDGAQPFAHADIVPITGERVERDPLNAANYLGYFTLQIGFYDSDFDGDRRAAAEKAVRVLRDEGEEAYYYHGPNMSLVCLGLFTQHDFVRKGAQQSGVDTYGPRITELQERFPHNLANGRTLEETINGQDLGAQPSCLVRIF